MINNYVTSKAIIAKVLADNALDEKDIKITDMKEWLAEAMEKIGSVNQLQHVVIDLPINHGQVKMPCDLYRLDQVGLNIHGHVHSMRKTTCSFSVFYTDSFDKTNMLIQPEKLIPLVKTLCKVDDDKAALELLNSDTNIKQTLGALINVHTTKLPYMSSYPHIIDLQYDTKPGFIICNVPCGTVKVSYYRIITDEDGMPMIPDMPSYSEALYWYITMKLFYPKYLSQELNREIYYDMRRSWNFYRKQAYADSLMPTTDEMESIKNDWNKLLPEINEHDNFFEPMGQEQFMYNQEYGV